MTLALTTRPSLELQVLLDYAHSVGLRFIKSDDVNVGPDAASVLLTVIDERLATVSIGEYDQPWVQELINARDELQSAICKAVEVG